MSTSTKEFKRLFSIPEAAVYLGRSDWPVRRLIGNGELPQIKAGRLVHVDVQDMEEFIEQHKGEREVVRTA